MSKLIKFAALFCCLAATAFVAGPIFAYRIEQPKQLQIQTHVISRSFSQVQPQGEKVRMVTSLKSRDLIRNEQDRFLEEPLLLSIGSKFKASDRHWGATYTLVAIQADGIILNYEAEGERPASIRNSAGQLHVSWK